MRVLRAAFAGLVCAAVATPAFAQRDPFMSYAVKPTKDQPAYGKTVDTKKLFAFFNDVLEPGNPQDLAGADVPGGENSFQVKKVKALCAPADVSGAAPTDADTHYVAYQVSAQKGYCLNDFAIPCKENADCGMGTCALVDKFDKKSVRNTSVRIGDDFVDLRVDFAKELMALVPATYDGAAHQGVPAGEEHYKCYAVKPTKASCVGGSNNGQSCKDVTNCPGGGTCVKNPKFPKETHPSGLSASITDQFTGLSDPTDPEKTFVLSKLAMFCQATDQKLASLPDEFRSEQQAGLICYKGKAVKLACDGGSKDNLPCKKDIDCDGNPCREEPKFDKANPALLGRYVEDGLFEHRLEVAKEDVFCMPACRGMSFDYFNGLASHITHLALGPNGAPAALNGLPRGVNVDGDLGTWVPNDEDPTGGIDNMLQGLGGILNPLLTEQLDTGGFTLLFQASALANGSVTISGFTGELADDPGCPVGTPPAAIDPGNPATPCNYTTVAYDTRGTCDDRPIISLDVNVSGAETAPTATASGGGPGNNFTLDIPFGDEAFQITAENVIVQATITHNLVGIDEIKGVLGGGVNHANLVAAVGALPNSCNGGANDGDECVNNAGCPGGTCELVGGFTAANLAAFIQGAFPPDLDLHPLEDGIYDARESVSIGLLFRATKANGN